MTLPAFPTREGEGIIAGRQPEAVGGNVMELTKGVIAGRGRFAGYRRCGGDG